MNTKDGLIHFIECTGEEIRAFIDGLSDEARAEKGTLERWSAKDVVAHLANWMSNRSEQLAAIPRGEIHLGFGPVNITNAASFERHRLEPWPSVLAFLEGARNQFISQVRSVPEAALFEERHSWIPNLPLWRAIARTSLIHPCLHLSTYFRQHSQPEAATKVLEFATDTGETLQGPPDWQATGPYNLACNYALIGDRERALEYLGGALDLFPGFAELAQQDNDLASLRDDPAFQALVDKASG